MADNRNTRAPGNHRRSIANAAPSPHLTDITVRQLRTYRQLLVGEKDKVSDWRRLAHARIDEATGELISGYQDDPASALIALPRADLTMMEGGR